MLKVESDGALEALSASVRKVLLARGVPFDDKPFRAHITLARDVSVAERIPDVPRIKTEISSVCLMNSEQLRGKRIYTRLYTNTI